MRPARLVSKVHREAERHFAGGGPDRRHILMIGHAGHPEVVGTMGQLPPGSMTLVQSVGDAETVEPAEPLSLAFITQTTLSVDDTAEIVETLRRRFPAIEGPKREDICYATTNRQAAVKAVARDCDLVVVIGSPNSSNSQRLREVAERAGASRAILLPRANEFDWSVMSGVRTMGLTAGASAPESLVQELLRLLGGALHAADRRAAGDAGGRGVQAAGAARGPRHSLRVYFRMHLGRSSDARFVRSDAHGPNARCVSVLGNTRHLTIPGTF